MAGIPSDYGTGGSGILSAPSGSTRYPAISTVLRDVADDLNASSGGVPDWVTGADVTTDVLALTVPGWILSVEATAATSAGPKQLVIGAPDAGQAQLVYDANGVPTITFNAADAVTEAAYQQIARPSGYTTQLTTKV